MVKELLATRRSRADVIAALQRLLGVTEMRAREIYAIETGASPGDIVELNG